MRDAQIIGLGGTHDCVKCWQWLPYRAAMLCQCALPNDEPELTPEQKMYRAGREGGKAFRKLIGLPELTNQTLSDTQVLFATLLGRAGALHLSLVERSTLTTKAVWKQRYIVTEQNCFTACGEQLAVSGVGIAVQKVEDVTCDECGALLRCGRLLDMQEQVFKNGSITPTE